MSGWAVWGELKRRVHLALVFGVLDNGDRGRLEDLGDGRRRVVLDARLGRRERRATLAHELVHDERGVLFDDDTPAGVVAKEEAWVQAETVRRLVPLDELDELVRREVTSGGTVCVHDVCDWFDVPSDVATHALAELQQRARQRHPSGRSDVP